MNARTLCLAILFVKEATGYEIRKQSVEGNFSYFVDVSFGAIYPALNRLTEDGLVECRDEVNPGKPARKVYSITPAGRIAFVKALHEPVEHDVFKSQFLLVSKFSDLVDTSRMARLLDDRIADLSEKLEMMYDMRQACTEPAPLWTINYGITVHEASLDYLRNNRDALLAISAGAHASEAAE